MWRSRKGPPLVDGFAELAARRIAVWPTLAPAEQTRLVELGSALIHAKRWEASRGFELTDEMVVTIAGQAALLILGLDLDAYAQVDSIIVHPAAVALRGDRPGSVSGTMTSGTSYILGQASHRSGPLVLAWADTRRASGRLLTSTNVVLHEFAHKIDMLDGTVDGTPPIVAADRHAEWVRVFTARYESLVGGTANPVLRSYGATNPGEFFAVATEAFFGMALDFRHHEPELHRLLAEFYRQDPAARLDPLIDERGIIRGTGALGRVRRPSSGVPHEG